jgi:hypothetical protein
MRLEMPDGTAVLLIPNEDGVVVASQGARAVDGTLPRPSGMLVTGDSAELLGALVDVVEEAETEAVLGTG